MAKKKIKKRKSSLFQVRKIKKAKKGKVFKVVKFKKNKKQIKVKKAKKIKKAKTAKIAKSVRKTGIKKKVNKINLKKKSKIKRKTAPAPVDSTIHKTRIRVIGIGGGGGTIISEISNRIKKADFYAANTDSQALGKLAPAVRRFQFGQSLTQGLGTGMNPELGELAAQTDKDKIKKLLEGQDLCIIVSCLGGGTSSGATPVFANISKNLGNITYGIFTLPFKFEGEKKIEAALESLEKIKNNFNVYTIIPNERIFQIIDKNTPLGDALSAINKRLTDNLEGLIDMIYSPGLINIDFADLRTILSGRGRLTYLSSIEAEGPNKEELIRRLISSPLYQYTIKGCRGILYNIVSGKNIQLSEVHQISNIISETISRNAKIIFGISQSPKYEDKIKVTLLAVGCSAKGFFSHPKKAPMLIKKKVKKKKVAAFKEKIEEEKKILPPKPRKPKPEFKEVLKKIKPKIKPKSVVKEEKPKPKPKPKLVVSVSKTPKIEQAKQEEKVEKVVDTYQAGGFPNEKVRRNALQVRKETEEEEKELLEQENLWETPAILRKNKE